MRSLTEKKIEFIAKTATDLGKALIILGFASVFFEKFPIHLRIFFSLSSFALLVLGIFIFPGGGEK